MFRTTDSTRARSRFFVVITLALTVVLAATPAFATEPEDADPDPDTLQWTTTLENLSEHVPDILKGVWYRIVFLVHLAGDEDSTSATCRRLGAA